VKESVVSKDAANGNRSASGREESEQERLDRNLGELLGELRVALPGVQVLFAFLLVVPFNNGFNSLTPGQERLYLATLLSSGLASALLIAPTAHHRLTFRLQDKEYLVVAANRFAIAGLSFLALAMIGAIGLVTDVVFSTTVAIVAVALNGLAFLALWIVWPLMRRTVRAREANGRA
jgi:hypothetical protein